MSSSCGVPPDRPMGTQCRLVVCPLTSQANRESFTASEYGASAAQRYSNPWTDLSSVTKIAPRSGRSRREQESL